MPAMSTTPRGSRPGGLASGRPQQRHQRRGLKGPSRPIDPAEARELYEVLSALEAVDAITIFDQDTPLELITAIHPDVLVKGGDYQPDQVVGRAEVEAAGGRLVLIPFADGHSTTRLVDRAAERELTPHTAEAAKSRTSGGLSTGADHDHEYPELSKIGVTNRTLRGQFAEKLDRLIKLTNGSPPNTTAAIELVQRHQIIIIFRRLYPRGPSRPEYPCQGMGFHVVRRSAIRCVR